MKEKAVEKEAGNIGYLPQRTWSRAESLKYEEPEDLFSEPLEITRTMLRGLRMVDETIIVYDVEDASGSKQ